MKSKKINNILLRIAFVLACLMLFTNPSYSQVAIGKDVKAQDGAALELYSDNKGLLLPKVALTSAIVWNPLFGSATEGMIVYNENDIKTLESGLEGIGVYVWSDGAWHLLDGEGCAVPAMPGQITFTPVGPIDQGDKFTASIAAVDGATSYIWELPEGLMGFSTTSTIEITAVKDGTYSAGTIKVKAVNDCGIGEARASSIAMVVNPVNPCVDCPKPGDIGPISFSSRTINKGDTFTASITPVTNATADFYYWVLPNGLTGHSSGPSITITAEKTGNYSGEDIIVYAVNDCGYVSGKGTGFINVTIPDPCPIPDTPGKITFYPKYSSLGSLMIVSVEPVAGADYYEWVLPSILSSTPIITNVPYLSFSVPSSIPPGDYTVKVRAVNNCGESGYSEDIMYFVRAGVCVVLSEHISEMRFNNTVQGSLYVSLSGYPAVIGIPTYYIWTYPEEYLEPMAGSYSNGLCVVKEGNALRFKVLKSGTFDGSQITVFARNYCSQTSVLHGSGSVTVTK
ncbi:hypothetical protein M2132_000397 [Dysgonomonas sp. PH5-45]|uniref:hypothetical protein n=1 Tax=unclassified Dysgonomonas TaxID=2630389 RepID=UPI00247464AC|nr:MULTISPECIES: hypothetical protein [unclassified Dysgonomonas]MDH6354075.1 hypothetical protein [Dysgonomonas sp. PH5-45]MDH6387074.1 hypothetical protein [Dysgonomonas sp. PH5-37]